MSFLKERLFIHAATPEGEDLLNGYHRLQEVVEQYTESPEECLASVPETNVIGEGSFSRVYSFNDELALKVSNPFTMDHSVWRQGYVPEDLREQFAVLSALRDVLYYKRDFIVVPEQFFVSHVPDKNYLLAQELMRGWVPLGDRMAEIYGPGAEDWGTFNDIERWTASFHKRIENSLGGFALMMTDLTREDGRFHGGNLLVPVDAPLHDMTPLCIIDQPGATESCKGFA
jgi:hypothetical protein